MARKKITVSLSESIAKRLSEKADNRGLSVSTLVQLALEEYLGKGEDVVEKNPAE